MKRLTTCIRDLLRFLWQPSPFAEHQPRTISERDWFEDFEHENGQYRNHCLSCDRPFIGHKRRVSCFLCADAFKKMVHGPDANGTARGLRIQKDPDGSGLVMGFDPAAPGGDWPARTLVGLDASGKPVFDGLRIEDKTIHPSVSIPASQSLTGAAIVDGECQCAECVKTRKLEGADTEDQKPTDYDKREYMRELGLLPARMPRQEPREPFFRAGLETVAVTARSYAADTCEARASEIEKITRCEGCESENELLRLVSDANTLRTAASILRNP